MTLLETLALVVLVLVAIMPAVSWAPLMILLLQFTNRRKPSFTNC